MNISRPIQIAITVTLIVAAGLRCPCLLRMLDVGEDCDLDAAPIAMVCANSDKSTTTSASPQQSPCCDDEEEPAPVVAVYKAVPACCDEGQEDACLECGVPNATTTATALKLPKLLPLNLDGLTFGTVTTATHEYWPLRNLVWVSSRAGPEAVSLFAQRCLLLI